MKKLFFAVLPLLLLLFASNCSSSSTNASTQDDSDDTSTTTDTELTLANCPTSIDSATPDFFQNYFKCSTISVEGDVAVVESNGLPPHRSYYYGENSPNFAEFDASRGDEYSPNPNTIAEQDIHLEIPVNPTAKGLTISEALVDGTVGTSDEEYSLGAVGIALDGVALFNPLAAPGDDIADEQFTFDSYNSHPTDTGFYHYHTNTPGPLEVLEYLDFISVTTLGSAEIELFGIMCDGTVVLGCTELDGSTPGDADFDAQNGHVHDLVDGDDAIILADRYHTHICPDVFLNHLYTPEIQYYETCVTD